MKNLYVISLLLSVFSAFAMYNLGLKTGLERQSNTEIIDCVIEKPIPPCHEYYVKGDLVDKCYVEMD